MECIWYDDIIHNWYDGQLFFLLFFFAFFYRGTIVLDRYIIIIYLFIHLFNSGLLKR